MAAVEDVGNLSPSLTGRLTSMKNSDWADTSSMTANDGWNRGSCHCRSAASFNCSHLETTHKDECAEVVHLRQLISEQNAMLEEQRRRIEETEQQIDDYERRIHDDRCATDGDDYLQRAYQLYDDDDRFVNQEIAFYYRAASIEISQRLVEVEAELADIANDCRRITSTEEKHSAQMNEPDRWDVGREAQSVVDGNGLWRRASWQLDALRLELARTDDVRRQQLLERHRLSCAVEDAQSLLKHEEERLKVAILAASSPLTNIQTLCHPQPSEIESKKLDANGWQQCLEKKLQKTLQPADADCQVPDVSPVALSTSPSAPGIKLLIGKSDIMCLTKLTSKSHLLCTPDDNLNSVQEDPRFDSLPDDDDLFTDRFQLVTLV